MRMEVSAIARATGWQNIGMHRLRALVLHPRAGPLMRYAVAGATVAAVYPGSPLVLTALLGTSIEAAIPLAYAAAVCLHFTLQRHFVFRHVPSFALSTRDQVVRYVVMGAVQYPSVAIATAVLPHALGVSARLVYLCTAVVVSAVCFVVLRTKIFHAAEDPAVSLGRTQAQETS